MSATMTKLSNVSETSDERIHPRCEKCSNVVDYDSCTSVNHGYNYEGLTEYMYNAEIVKLNPPGNSSLYVTMWKRGTFYFIDPSSYKQLGCAAESPLS